MIDVLQNKFKKLIEENPEKYYNDFLKSKEEVKNSTAIYKGKPVNFLYQGLFFSEEEYREFQILLKKITEILNRIILEYKENSLFRKYFPFSELMEELILIDPGYSVNFPVGRFDIFYNKDGNHIFCELNTDGASAMNEVRVLQEIIGNSLAFAEFKDKYKFTGFELFYTWLEGLINNYKEYNQGIDDKPNIAIVDFAGEGTIYEFKEFQKRFIKKGYNTFICDPRELKYTNSKLYYKDNHIKLIYRRATSIRLVEEADDIQDILSAYRDGNVCVVGGFVSQIIHNKVLFAILHDEEKISFLPKRDKEFIKKYIPYTGILDFNNEEIIKELIITKDRWILKPFDQYAGKGVYAGRDFGPGEWKKILNNIIDQDYIYQEFIEIPVLPIANFEESGEFENFGFLIGLFTYNNRLAGIYTRAGRKNIIGDIAESFTVPNYICRNI